MNTRPRPAPARRASHVAHAPTANDAAPLTLNVAEQPAPATGIDYLGLIDARHTAELAGKVNYSALTSSQDDPRDDEPGTGDREQP